MKLNRVLYLLVANLSACIAQAQTSSNDIQDRINLALSNSQSEVTIPAGRYPASFFDQYGAHLYIHNRQNFTVRAAGVTMVCSKRGSAISISGCTNVIIEGLKIDYNPLPFTQGTIISATSNWSSIEVQIHDGYPADDITESKVEIFDKTTRLIKKDIWTLYGRQVQRTGPTTFRVNGTEGFAQHAAIGDFVTLDMPSVNAHGIRVDKSRKTTLRNVDLYAAPVFGIYEFLCDSSTYDHVNIVPGPIPMGATQPRLKTATADGIHSTSATTGPRVENCRIENIGDDGIAIHGLYDYGLSVSGNRLGLVSRWGTLDMAVGDTIYNLNNDGTLHFAAKILAAAPATGSDLANLQNQRAALSFQIPGFFDGYFMLTLSQSVTLEPGTAVNSINKQGNGFIVRNNFIHNKRARGILIKASDGLIENNTIDRTTMAGIVLAPEFYWMEAGLSRNVKILGNKLRHCGINPEMGGVQAGIISVVAESKDNQFTQAFLQQKIEIAGNTLDSCLGVNVLVSSATGISIHDNVMRHPNYENRNHGANLGLNGNTAVWLQNVKGATLSNNQVYCRGGEQMLAVVNSTQVTGNPGGVFCVSDQPSIGTGNGLKGSYYNGKSFNRLVSTRIDPQLNFNWGGGSPLSGVANDAFSIRWTGQIQAKYSGKHTFYIRSDNGRRVWVNNALIVDKWLDDWDITYTGTIDLVKGQKYPIQIEYFENVGGANILLEWSAPSLPREIVPKSQLYSTLPSRREEQLAEAATLTDFRIYPNPSGDQISVTSSTDDNTCTLSLRDWSGKILYQADYTGFAQWSKQQLGLRPGFYLVQLTSNQTIITKKLIIQ